MKVFNPLQYRSCLGALTPPAHESAWQEHFPFGMLLVELLRPRVLVELGRMAVEEARLVLLDEVGALPVSALSWADALTLGRKAPPVDHADTLTAHDLACFIYTSGTGGRPKGVMLSHNNIMANLRGAWGLLERIELGHETFLSFLPLSHAYEHTAGQFLPIAMGAEIYYAARASASASSAIAPSAAPRCESRCFSAGGSSASTQVGRTR